MSSQVMFGKTGVNSQVAPAPQFLPQPNTVAVTDAYDDAEIPEHNGENLNEMNFSLGNKSDYIPQDKSVIFAVLLWFFLGGAGAHRFYLGHKFVGFTFVIAGVIVLASLFGAGVTATVDSLASRDVNMASLISTFGFMAAYFVWSFLDIFYIGIRYLINKHG